MLFIKRIFSFIRAIAVVCGLGLMVAVLFGATSYIPSPSTFSDIGNAVVGLISGHKDKADEGHDASAELPVFPSAPHPRHPIEPQYPVQPRMLVLTPEEKMSDFYTTKIRSDYPSMPFLRVEAEKCTPSALAVHPMSAQFDEINFGRIFEIEHPVSSMGKGMGANDTDPHTWRCWYRILDDSGKNTDRRAYLIAPTKNVLLEASKNFISTHGGNEWYVIDGIDLTYTNPSNLYVNPESHSPAHSIIQKLGSEKTERELDYLDSDGNNDTPGQEYRHGTRALTVTDFALNDPSSTAWSHDYSNDDVAAIFTNAYNTEERLRLDFPGTPANTKTYGIANAKCVLAPYVLRTAETPPYANGQNGHPQRTGLTLLALKSENMRYRCNFSILRKKNGSGGNYEHVEERFGYFLWTKSPLSWVEVSGNEINLYPGSYGIAAGLFSNAPEAAFWIEPPQPLPSVPKLEAHQPGEDDAANPTPRKPDEGPEGNAPMKPSVAPASPSDPSLPRLNRFQVEPETGSPASASKKRGAGKGASRDNVKPPPTNSPENDEDNLSI